MKKVALKQKPNFDEHPMQPLAFIWQQLPQLASNTPVGDFAGRLLDS